MLRDGRWVTEPRARRASPSDDLVRAMVGRELVERETEARRVGATVLKVERLSREGFFTDVSFEVKAGEIVALAGLVGAGRSEVACSIFGIDRYDAGSVTVNGRAAAARPRRRRDGRRRRPRAGGPAPAGARHGHVDLAEHRARVAPAAAAARLHPLRRPSAASPADWGHAAPAQVRHGSPTRRTRSRAATSRRSCSPSGSAASRRS